MLALVGMGKLSERVLMISARKDYSEGDRTGCKLCATIATELVALEYHGLERPG